MVTISLLHGYGPYTGCGGLLDYPPCTNLSLKLCCECLRLTDMQEHEPGWRYHPSDAGFRWMFWFDVVAFHIGLNFLLTVAVWAIIFGAYKIILR